MLANWWFSDLIVVGTFWFWALVIAVCIAMVILVEIEKAGFAFLVLLATLGIFQFASDFNVLEYVWHHPLNLFMGIVAYAIVGVLWSLVKFRWYMFIKRERYDILKHNFMILKDQPEGTAVIPDELKADWATYLTEKGPYYDRFYYLRSTDVTENQGRIVSWIAYWPFSFIFTILNDPLRKIGNAIFQTLKSTYISIAKSAFKGVEDDFNADDLKKFRQTRQR